MSAEETVRNYIRALNGDDVDAVVGWVSNNFVNEHTAVLGDSVTGRDAYRSRLATFFAEFPQRNYEVEEIIADHGRIAVPYRLSATWLATASVDSPRPFAIRGMFRFEVENALITKRTDYWDSAEFERQVKT